MVQSNMKLILIVCWALTVAIPLRAQLQEGRCRIRGQVIDTLAQAPLSYATIGLWRTSDSTLLTGVSTDEQGEFLLAAPPGSYELKISFVGYHSTSTPVQLSQAGETYDIGELFLSADTQELSEVEIRGQRSHLVSEPGKKTFYVGEDVASHGGSALDLLDYVPSVSADLDGTVRLRGASASVQVNGRESGLSREEALKQLPGHLIERIEIITNPSASESAAGSGGVINIILKKDQADGINGGVTVTGGHPLGAQVATNLNRKRGPWYLYGLYGYDNARELGWDRRLLEEYRTSQKKEIRRRQTQNTQHKVLERSHAGGVGFEYRPDEKSVLEGESFFQVQNEQYGQAGNRREEGQAVGRSASRVRQEVERERGYEWEQELSYERTLRREGQEVEVSVGWEYEAEEAEEQVREISEQEGAGEVEQQARSQETEKEWELEAGYTHPLGNDRRLSAGYKAELSHSRENQWVQRSTEERGEFSLREAANEVSFHQSVHAGFIEYGHELENFFYRLGVRSEFTTTSITSPTVERPEQRQYVGFFPDLLLEYAFGRDHTLELGYSRSIDRPGLRYLNPFVSQLDAQRVYRGNPDLAPEYSHSIELEYLRAMKQTTLGIGTYARYQAGIVQRIATLEDGITVASPQNFSTGRAYGGELYWGGEVTSWYSFDTNLDIRYESVSGTEQAPQLANRYVTYEGVIRQMLNWNAYRFQVAWHLQGPEQRTYQERRRGMQYVDLGLSRSVLNNRGRLTFRVSDLFNTRIEARETLGADFLSIREQQRRQRQFFISFFYRINQKDSRSDKAFDSKVNSENTEEDF